MREGVPVEVVVVLVEVLVTERKARTHDSVRTQTDSTAAAKFLPGGE